MLEEINRYIHKAQGLPHLSSIVMETLPHTQFENAYHARYRAQQHYNGETYQL